MPAINCTAFEGPRRIASGALPGVALAVKKALESGATAPVLMFDDATGEQIDVDLRGKTGHELHRSSVPESAAAPEYVPEPPPRRPGRPKLGVVGREVTLLPRHWEWLDEQPGGASVTLRKLVEQAKKANQARDEMRRSREAAYRFMSVMAGNEAGFEEAIRALFAGNRERFEALIGLWPADVRDHSKSLAQAAFAPAASE